MNSISSIHASAIARQRTDQAAAAARAYSTRRAASQETRAVASPGRAFRVQRTQPAGV